VPAFVSAMELRIDIAGEIVERQELLNGTLTVAFEGADASGEWTLAGSLSWNRGLVDYAGEGDVTLVRSDGAELFATLIRASVIEAADDAHAGYEFRASYEVDGGGGEFGQATGSATASGTLAGDAVNGTWEFLFTAP